MARAHDHNHLESYSAIISITTPALCDMVQRLLGDLRTQPYNYSTVCETIPRVCIFTQRVLAQKWSTFFFPNSIYNMIV